MEWVYEKPVDHLYDSLAFLTLKKDDEVVRSFQLIDASDKYELRELTPNRRQVLSGRGWSSYPTKLNCTETLKEIVEENGYPQIPEDILQDIFEWFDNHPYKYSPRQQ